MNDIQAVKSLFKTFILKPLCFPEHLSAPRILAYPPSQFLLFLLHEQKHPSIVGKCVRAPRLTAVREWPLLAVLVTVVHTNPFHPHWACFPPHGLPFCWPRARFPLNVGCPCDSSEQEPLSLTPSEVRKGAITTTGSLTCCAARGIEGEHGLNGDVHGRDVEGFKHDLKGQCRIKDCLAETTAPLGPQKGFGIYIFFSFWNLIKGREYAYLPYSHLP